MSRRFLFVFLLAFGLLLSGLIARNGTPAMMALPLIAYLVAGVATAPRPGSLRLQAERTVEIHRDSDTAAVTVRVTLQNRGAAVPALWLQESAPPGVVVAEGSLCRGASLARGEEVDLRYTFHTAHGVFRWDSIEVVASDPFRLFECHLAVAAPGEVVVRPRVKRFPSFPINPGLTLHSPGLVPSGRAGSGTDFWGVRDYQPGDPLRHLDWRRAARHPGQLFTRELEQEEIADLGIVLDAREQCDLPSGAERLFDFARDAAASLAEMVLRHGNRVGMILVGSAVNVVYPGYGKVQLNRILRVLASAEAPGEASRLSLDHVPLRVFSGRAMVVVISPLTAGDWQIFPRLRARGNDGVLLSPDPVDFVKTGAVDEAGRLALRLARLERRLTLRRVSQVGLRVVDWPVASPLAPLLRRALQPARGGRA